MGETGDTDHITKRTQLNIANWQLEVIKWLAVGACTFVAGWINFSVANTKLENKVGNNTQSISHLESSITKLEAANETSKTTDNSLQAKLGTLEMQQTLVSGEFRDSLKRIEDDVKELKTDLKNGKSNHGP